ncbi:MAG: cation:proton antiporter [Candidatus Woesearchaeota archaeon]
MDPIVSILVCLIVLYLLAELCALISIPRVVGQIAAGMLLGLPAVRGFVFTTESISLISFLADIGVILLLFFVGLQINFKQFERAITPSAWISFFNTALPLLFGFLISKYAFGLGNNISIIVGVCMSVSATAIALDLMEEFNKLRTKLGALIVSAGTFDDLVELFLITGVLTFIESAIKQTTLLELIFGIFFFSIVVLIFRFWLIPFILRLIEHQPERAQLFTGALVITLIMAALAEHLGIGALIGALFSGVIIRQVLMKDPGHKPWERQEITHTIHSIAFGFLVPFFFLHVGFQTDLLAIWNNIGFGLIITILAIVGTVVGSALGYYVVFHNWKEGWITGWAMNAKGDTELVIAELALSAGVITTTVFSSLIFMAVISTLISPLVLRHLLKKM